MKRKIILQAAELFLIRGFKTVTMEDIAKNTGVSKKTLYSYFGSKELLVSESIEIVHTSLNDNLNSILGKNFNAIEENFQIQKIFKQMFSANSSCIVNELKSCYNEIYTGLIEKEMYEFQKIFKQNIDKGIKQGLYKCDLNYEYYKFFYSTLVFNLDKNNTSQTVIDKLEIQALEYHIRAIATAKGVLELEKQLKYLKKEASKNNLLF